MAECIIWKKALNKNGYGVTWSGGKKKNGGRNYEAHKLAYERVHGPVPTGMVLDHLCRNRACVNVAHLRVVTPAVNVQSGDSAKLNPDKIGAMRFLYSTGSYSQVDLGKMFGVGQDQVSRIINRLAWANI